MTTFSLAGIEGLLISPNYAVKETTSVLIIGEEFISTQFGEKSTIPSILAKRASLKHDIYIQYHRYNFTP